MAKPTSQRAKRAETWRQVPVTEFRRACLLALVKHTAPRYRNSDTQAEVLGDLWDVAATRGRLHSDYLPLLEWAEAQWQMSFFERDYHFRAAAAEVGEEG